jgi:hypothetical protein
MDARRTFNPARSKSAQERQVRVGAVGVVYVAGLIGGEGEACRSGYVWYSGPKSNQNQCRARHQQPAVAVAVILGFGEGVWSGEGIGSRVQTRVVGEEETSVVQRRNVREAESAAERMSITLWDRIFLG